MACIATLFLALAVAIFLLELGVSLEWTRDESKSRRWTEAIPNLFSRRGKVADRDGHHLSADYGDKLGGDGEHLGGLGGDQDLTGGKRAYAVGHHEK